MKSGRKDPNGKDRIPENVIPVGCGKGKATARNVFCTEASGIKKANVYFIIIKRTMNIRRKIAHMPNAELGEPWGIFESVHRVSSLQLLAIATTAARGQLQPLPVAPS